MLCRACVWLYTTQQGNPNIIAVGQLSTHVFSHMGFRERLIWSRHEPLTCTERWQSLGRYPFIYK